MKTQRVALVTGANRGIGLEIAAGLGAKGLTVYLGCRDEEKSAQAVAALESRVPAGQFRRVALDVADKNSIALALAFIARESGGLEVLVNNAGILDERTDAGSIMESFRTNAIGPYLLCESAVPQMIARGYGRVVNLSTGMAQLSEMNGGYPAYRMSKVALNAVTRIFHDLASDSGADVQVNSMCPGWVKTEMGGPGAEREVSEGADTALWLATHPTGGPSGGFFRDRTPIAW